MSNLSWVSLQEIERKCDVCYSRLARVETLDKVLRIDGEFVMSVRHSRRGVRRLRRGDVQGR